MQDSLFPRSAGPASAPSKRRARAVESFRTAAECIGPVEPGMALFAVTRGQFSMIDAVLYCLDQVGPAAISLWTWTIADYEVDQCVDLLSRGEITSGLLLLNGERPKNLHANAAGADIVGKWRAKFGPESVRDVMNHAKIASVASADGRFRLLLRGSMNLNFNPRFEQLDITEGGPDFDLVKEIEAEIPILRAGASSIERHQISRTGDAFPPEMLGKFVKPDAAAMSGLKVWAK